MLRRCGSDPGMGAGTVPRGRGGPGGGVAAPVPEPRGDFLAKSPRQLQTPSLRAARPGRCSHGPVSAGKCHITDEGSRRPALGATTKRWGCSGNPAPFQPGAHPPGSWAGSWVWNQHHGSGKAGFPYAPGEASRWRGENGAFSSVGFPHEQGEPSKPCGTCTGEGSAQHP